MILGTRHDPHHLCSDILAILVLLHFNWGRLSCLSVLLRCCERFIISLVRFCSPLEVIRPPHIPIVSRPRDLTGTVPLCSLLPSGNAVALVSHVLINTTHVRVATVAFNDDSVVYSHTLSTSLHVIVVGDQDAIHVLIRVRHRSRSSPRVFPQSVCVSHNNAEFLQTTLGLVLLLVDLVLVSGLLCLLHHPINIGLRQFPFHHDTLGDRGLDAIVCGL